MVKKKTPKKPSKKASKPLPFTEAKRPRKSAASPEAADESEENLTVYKQPKTAKKQKKKQKSKAKAKNPKQTFSAATESQEFVEFESEEDKESPFKRNTKNKINSKVKPNKTKSPFLSQDSENENNLMDVLSNNKKTTPSKKKEKNKNSKIKKTNKKPTPISKRSKNASVTSEEEGKDDIENNSQSEEEEVEVEASKMLKNNFSETENFLGQERELVDSEIPGARDYSVLPDFSGKFNRRFFSAKFFFDFNKTKKSKKPKRLFFCLQIVRKTSSKELFLWSKSAEQGLPGDFSLEKCKNEKEAIKLFLKEHANKLNEGFQLEDLSDKEAKEEKNGLEVLSKAKNTNENQINNNNKKAESLVINTNKKERNLNKDKSLIKAEESLFASPAPIKSKTATAKKNKSKKPCLFDETVESLLLLLSDDALMRKQMSQIGYDVLKLPFERLTTQRLQAALAVLSDVEQVLSKNKEADLFELSSVFYRIIPQSFGSQRMSGFAIDSFKKLKEKTEMVEALADIETAVKLLAESNKNRNEMSKLNCLYKELNCEIKTIDEKSELFNLLSLYLKNNTANNQRITIQIESAFGLAKAGEAEKAQLFSGNKKLLWHGLRSSSLISALFRGVKIADGQAPCSCFRFGKGIYFTDMAEKAIGYCYPFDNTALVLLCEVALGKVKEMKQFDCKAEETLEGYDSVLGCGMVFPNPVESKEIEGVEVPLGVPVFSKEKVFD